MNTGRTRSSKSDIQTTDFQRRIVNGVVISSILFIATLLILSLAGVSDPRPLGEIAWVDEFTSNDGWAMQGATDETGNPLRNGQISAAANTLILMKSPYRLQTPGSLVLLFRQVSGAPDSGYGLWIATEGGFPLVIGINADTYLGIFEPPPSTAEPIRPWHVFPHVRKLGEPNKLQVDFNDSKLTIWLNDERVTQIDYSAQALTAGLYVETYDESAVFRFERLEGWQK